MKRRLWKLSALLLGLFLLAAGLWSYDRWSSRGWEKKTELEIEFLATDYTTKEPVSEALITIRSDGGSSEEMRREPKLFFLATDANDVARKTYSDAIAIGKDSGLGVTSTLRRVRMPQWHYQVHRDGYYTSAIIELDVAENFWKPIEVAPGKIKVVVLLNLEKKK